MSKKKRGGYKCGRCGESGHNARTCPTKAAATKPTTTEPTPVTTPVTPPPVTEPVVTETKAETPEVETPKAETAKATPVAISSTQDLTTPQKNTRPARPPSPFDCPTCKQVGILVLVELEDGTPQLRCEHCHNKVKCNVILRWGAVPADKPGQLTK